MSKLSGKTITLIITGGIAAYKSLELIRLLRRQDVRVVPVLTESAKQFVTPMSVAGLAQEKVYDDMFSLMDEVDMGHIQLSRIADLIVVCPATADLMARHVGGLANDLATTLLLATDTPVMMAPAMNVRMWDHPATQKNVATLKEWGVTIIQPATGEMACGEEGVGRLPEPEEIIKEIEAHFGS